MVSMFHFLFQFGIAGFLLFICALATSIITMERAYFLFILHSPWKRDLFLASLLEILEEEKYKPIHIREIYISQEIERIEALLSKGLTLVRFISVAAPMCGLFGTILGMISIFGAIAESTQAITPSLVSKGLKEALYATAMGISVAVPSVGVNLFFHRVVNARMRKYLYILNIENAKLDYKDND